MGWTVSSDTYFSDRSAVGFWQLEACRAPLGRLKGLVLGLTCPLCGLNCAKRSISGHMEGV